MLYTIDDFFFFFGIVKLSRHLFAVHVCASSYCLSVGVAGDHGS